MSYFFRNLHLSECQLDELWTFIFKKEDQLTSLDKLLGIYGDAWVWIAFSPVCKLVPATQTVNHLPAVHAGRHHVEYYHVGMRLSRQPQAIAKANAMPGESAVVSRERLNTLIQNVLLVIILPSLTEVL